MNEKMTILIMAKRCINEGYSFVKEILRQGKKNPLTTYHVAKGTSHHKFCNSRHCESTTDSRETCKMAYINANLINIFNRTSLPQVCPLLITKTTCETRITCALRIPNPSFSVTLFLLLSH